jgi:hypothetical protein
MCDVCLDVVSLLSLLREKLRRPLVQFRIMLFHCVCAPPKAEQRQAEIDGGFTVPLVFHRHDPKSLPGRIRGYGYCCGKPLGFRTDRLQGAAPMGWGSEAAMYLL